VISVSSTDVQDLADLVLLNWLDEIIPDQVLDECPWHAAFLCSRHLVALATP